MNNNKLMYCVGPQYKDTFDEVAIGLAQVDLKGKFLRVNNYLCKLLGYSSKELLDLTFRDISLPEDLDDSLLWIQGSLAGTINTSFSKVKRYRCKNNELVWTKLTTTLKRDASNQPDYFISSIQDITDLKKAETTLDKTITKLSIVNKELERLSRQDPLTGLLNFKAFREHLIESFQRFQRDQVTATLVFIDADKFKRVNDLYGHLAGDSILQKIASTLASNARNIDFVARYGGDEFAVLLSNSDADKALQYCKRVGQEITLNLEDGTIIAVGISFGACEIKPAFSSVDVWLAEADKLMYQDKS